MRTIKFLIISLLLIVFFGSFIVEAAPSDLVYTIDVEGEVNSGLARFIEKSIDRAETDGAEAIILQITTFGGLVDSAVAIRDILIDTSVMTVAYVKDRAWSAGALITLACDKIYMSPGSSMGAAETRPNEEKYISAFRKEFKTTAEKQGRNSDIAAAMVDSDIAIDGVIEKGKLLTLTASEATELGMADLIVTSQHNLLADLGFEDGIIRKLEPTLIDRFARYVTNPYVGSILITVGFVALVVEAITLGWGVAGTIGILSLATFFSGNLLVGNTNWGLILLFVAGMILLALELFVVPGFGVTGLGGIILVIASLFLTFNDPTIGLYAVSFSLISSIIITIILFRFFGKSKTWNRIALTITQSKENGYLAAKTRSDLLGLEGEALTTLRPTGTALIAGERIDVLSESSYIEKGNKIKVVKIEGVKVIVREI